MKKSSMWKSLRRENEKFQNTFEKLKMMKALKTFKEDSVREELLKPLLDKLGFVNKSLNGVRDTTLKYFRKNNHKIR